MPNFPNPYAGNIERRITKDELLQAIRMDIAGELEAIFLYEAHALATYDPLAKKVLMEIRDEEVTHVGQLMTLLRHLDEGESTHFMAGESEVKAMMQELGIPVD